MTSELHVIFGTGPVGMAILDELCAQGKPVRMVNRSGKADLPAGVELMAGDATNHEFARRAAEGASHIYFALNPPYERWSELFPPLQTSVLNAAIETGAKFIVMENLYAYGPRNGQPMTEDMTFEATDSKGITRAKMTEELLAAHQAGKVRVTMGRASDFFGPRVLGAMGGEFVFGHIKAGKTVQVIGKLDQPHTQTYMPDIGKALVLLGERDDALGQAWHIPSPSAITMQQFIDMAEEAMGKEAKVQAISSRFMLNLLGLFVPMLREFKGTFYQFAQPYVMDDSKFRRTFGVDHTPMQQAINETAAWYQAHYEPSASS